VFRTDTSIGFSPGCTGRLELVDNDGTARFLDADGIACG
jgi:hypothetical protein